MSRAMFLTGWVGLTLICLHYLSFWPWMAVIACKLLIAAGAMSVGVEDE